MAKEQSLFGSVSNMLKSVFGTTTKSVMQLEKAVDIIDNYTDESYEDSIKSLLRLEDDDTNLTDEQIEEFYVRKQKLADIRKKLR